LIDQYHWLLVGTTDTIRKVVYNTDQVRTVMERPRVLAPLPLEDLFIVLERRYDMLRHDSKQQVIVPVSKDVVRDVFTLFRGDLLSGRLDADADRIAMFAEHLQAGQSFTQKQSEHRGTATASTRTPCSALHSEWCGAAGVRSTAARAMGIIRPSPRLQ